MNEENYNVYHTPPYGGGTSPAIMCRLGHFSDKPPEDMVDLLENGHEVKCRVAGCGNAVKLVY